MRTADSLNAWKAAQDRFRLAYGTEPDLTDETTDKPVFLGLLEQEIRASIENRLAGSVRDAAGRIAAIDTGSRAI